MMTSLRRRDASSACNVCVGYRQQLGDYVVRAVACGLEAQKGLEPSSSGSLCDASFLIWQAQKGLEGIASDDAAAAAARAGNTRRFEPRLCRLYASSHVTTVGYRRAGVAWRVRPVM